MKTAAPTDWKTEPLPGQKTTIRLDRTFSWPEMARIYKGLIPEQMESGDAEVAGTELNQESEED